MDIDNKKGLRIHVAPCFICWRPCNWWGRWLSLLGIFIFCAKAQKGGDGVDMEGVFVYFLIFKVIFIVLKFIVLIDACNRCETNYTRKRKDRI